jgi:hypothetical protein
MYFFSSSRIYILLFLRSLGFCKANNPIINRNTPCAMETWEIVLLSVKRLYGARILYNLHPTFLRVSRQARDEGYAVLYEINIFIENVGLGMYVFWPPYLLPQSQNGCLHQLSPNSSILGGSPTPHTAVIFPFFNQLRQG